MGVKKTLLITGYLVIVTCAILAVSELFLRLRGYDPNEFDAGDGIRIIFDGECDYRVKPGCRPDINESGFRDRPFSLNKGDKKRVLMMGDSFVMGLNVPSEQTLPKMLERKLGEGWEVFNMGILGYGPDQSLVRLMGEGLAFAPDIVILGIYARNDFNDIYKNRLYDDRGGILTRTPGTSLITESGMERPRSRLCGLLRNLFQRKKIGIISGTLLCDGPDLLLEGVSDREKKINLMRIVLRRFSSLARERGFSLVVVIIPGYENIVGNQPLVNEDVVTTLCAEESIPAINLYPLFLKENNKAALYDKNDHHFSRVGNALVADILSRYITREAQPR